MKITTLQTKSFKNLADGVLEFGDDNKISGRNGSGKSSIAEAVIFALYGRTRTGSNSSNDLIKNSEETSVVAIQFDTGTTLVREESRFYGSKIQLNGTVIDQKDLDENIPNHKEFMSTFLIGYFFSMDEADQRELILNLTDEIDLKELFIEVTRKPELLEKHLINFSQIDKELKLFKTKLKDLKTLVDHGQVQTNMLDSAMKDIKQPKKKIDTEKIEADIKQHKEMAEYLRIVAINEALDSRIKSLQAGKCDTCDQSIDDKKIEELCESLAAQKQEEPKKPSPKSLPSLDELQSKLAEALANNQLYDGFEEQILELQKQKSDKEDQIRSAKELIPELEEIVNALSPKGIKAMEMRKKLDPIVKMLNTDKESAIKIETLDKLKTKDSYREVFNVFLNDVPYKYLSTGERKLMDIKFSQLINSYKDIDVFFLDDAELLSHNDNLTGQVFKAYVTSEDLKLEVK